MQNLEGYNLPNMKSNLLLSKMHDTFINYVFLLLASFDKSLI